MQAPARASTDPGGITIDFVTRGGRVAKSVAGPSAHVALEGLEGYVRARVTYVAHGKAFYAWTQPIRLD